MAKPIYRNNFAELGDQWHNLIALQLNAAAQSMVDVAKQMVPVDTRRSQLMIDVKEEADSESLHAVAWAPAETPKGDPYDIYVEFGTIYQDAQPFWTPAFQLARHQLLNSLRSLVSRGEVSVSYGVFNLSNPSTFTSR